MQRYRPANAFVMDVVVMKIISVKIVEYNCINCAGFYAADVKALAGALTGFEAKSEKRLRIMP